MNARVNARLASRGMNVARRICLVSSAALWMALAAGCTPSDSALAYTASTFSFDGQRRAIMLPLPQFCVLPS